MGTHPLPVCVTGLRPGRPGLPGKPGDPGGRAFQPQDIGTAAWARNCSPERPPCTSHPKAKDGAPPCSHLRRSAGHCGPREARAAARNSKVACHQAAAECATELCLPPQCSSPPQPSLGPVRHLWDRSPSGTAAACPAQERDGLPPPLWTHSLCRVKLHSSSLSNILSMCFILF